MWITLTVDQIQNSLSTAERLTMTATDSAADLQDILQSVVALIVGKFNSYSPNQGNGGPVGTIPDETLGAAIVIARFKFLTSLPGTQLITKWREQEKDEAYDLLENLASGKLVVVGGGGSDATKIPQRQATTAPGNYGETGEPFFPPYGAPPRRPVWGPSENW